MRFLQLLVLTLFLSGDVVFADRDPAIAEIMKLGGRVQVNDDSFAKPIVVVDLQETQLTDDQLKNLKLPDVESLYVSKTRITDSGLIHLRQFTRLRGLKLSSVAGVTDAGLAHLQHLKKLERLDLQGTGVTGSGFRHLAELQNLRAVFLSGDRITDESVAELTALKNLDEVLLAYTKVTDDGIARLSSLPRLQSIHIRSGRITDVGLMSLAKVSDLQLLQVPSTPKVTDSGISGFRVARPLVRIQYGERPRLDGQ